MSLNYFVSNSERFLIKFKKKNFFFSTNDCESNILYATKLITSNFFPIPSLKLHLQTVYTDLSKTSHSLRWSMTNNNATCISVDQTSNGFDINPDLFAAGRIEMLTELSVSYTESSFDSNVSFLILILEKWLAKITDHMIGKKNKKKYISWSKSTDRLNPLLNDPRVVRRVKSITTRRIE